MRKTITTLVDDVDGSVAAETIGFALDGKAYEIDLSEKSAGALRAPLLRMQPEPAPRAGRDVPGARCRQQGHLGPRRSAPGRPPKVT